ncbi:MAG: C-terminal helicase domain-containing protein, partial [Fimbriimonadaceae bacterium]
LRKSILNRIDKLDLQFEMDSSIIQNKLPSFAMDREGEEETNAEAALMDIGYIRDVEKAEWQKILDELSRITSKKDAKLQALCTQVLPELFEISSKSPLTPARVIIFTPYKDTLKAALDCPVFCLHGELSDAARNAEFDKFAESKRAVLIATDVISEGVNLQGASCMVVHECVPYNPNRLDQRNGRVDRYGQKSPMVYIRTLYCRDTSDEDVMGLLVRKLERMRRDLGFAPPFFATDETVLRVIKKRRSRSKANVAQLSFEDEEQWFDLSSVAKMQSEGFYGQADVRVAEVSDKLNELYDRVGTPEELRRHIVEGLRYFSCQVNEKSDQTLEVKLGNPRLQVPGIPKELPRVVLNPEEKAIHPTATLIDVGHPVTRRLNALIRQAGFLGEERARSAAYISPEVPRATLIVHGLLRAVSQTQPPVLLEELVTFGIEGGLEGGPLTAQEAELRSKAKASSLPVINSEAIERIKEFVTNPSYTQAREKAIADTLARITRFRVKAKQELEKDAETAWTPGYDQIELMGFEVYGFTLILPERK